MTSIFNSAQYKNQRVAVLIDVQNLYHSARALFQKRVNFKELLSSALGERQLVRAFAYVVRTKTGEEKSFFYRLKPVERGEYQFGHVNIYVSLLLKLVKRRYKSGQPEIVPVYPSYLQMHKYGIFAISDKLTEVGIKKIRRIGHHYEFDQVKEYVKGDDYRTINWKATSRRSQLMVNQYLDERAQCIYCIIDKGRLMEKAFKGMTYLDYAVNSSLVLLNIALQKYDKAGLVTFNTRVDTFLPAERKNTTINKILESLYNQKTSFSESNFELLYVNLKNKIKQRSLLVLYSNFGGLVSLNRNIDYLKGLAKSHLLLFILFKNTEINDLIAKYPSTLEDVYISTIAEKFEYEQKLLAAELNRHGIYTVLTAPENLTLDLINKYFEFKSLGFI